MEAILALRLIYDLPGDALRKTSNRLVTALELKINTGALS